jgi:hypothetical protein
MSDTHLPSRREALLAASALGEAIPTSLSAADAPPAAMDAEKIGTAAGVKAIVSSWCSGKCHGT